MFKTTDIAYTLPSIIQWCFESFDNQGKPISCAKNAMLELFDLGVTVKYMAKYVQSSDWDPAVMLQCTAYDKKIVSGRVYTRLVLPLNNSEVR